MKNQQNYFIVNKSKQFDKSYSKILKSGISKKDSETINNVILKLSRGEKLEQKFKDHPLFAQYAGMRECHIRPDLLLVYYYSFDQLVLFLFDTDTHSSLFD